MKYDFTGVTEIRHDRERRRVELVANGERKTIEGVDRLYLKSAGWVEPDGTAHLNRGRVSVGNGEVVAGD